ncbi:MAG: SIMPL domain-containing protein [Clostridia bacterium]|nr:SIMPL domain-containing protein [Clostridia bacterium]
MKKMTALILMLVLLMTMGGAALADDTITVSGTATVQLQPDMVMIHLGVTATDAAVLVAQRTVNEAMNKVIEALTAEELGIASEDIATAQYRIEEEYEYSSIRGTSEKIGYSAIAMLSVCVRDLDKAGTVIDAAMQAGANQLGGVEFMSSDQTGARDQALTLAVQDGMRKAKVIAAAAGVELPPIPASIVEKESYSYAVSNSVVMYDMAMTTEGSAATTLQAGLLSLTAKVEITYEID